MCRPSWAASHLEGQEPSLRAWLWSRMCAKYQGLEQCWPRCLCPWDPLASSPAGFAATSFCDPYWCWLKPLMLPLSDKRTVTFEDDI